MLIGQAGERGLQRTHGHAPVLGRGREQGGGVLALLVGHLAAAAHDGRVVGVSQNGEEPGPEIGARLELGPVGPGLDQGVLHQVVGVRGVVAERPGKGAKGGDERNAVVPPALAVDPGGRLPLVRVCGAAGVVLRETHVAALCGVRPGGEPRAPDVSMNAFATHPFRLLPRYVPYGAYAGDLYAGTGSLFVLYGCGERRYPHGEGPFGRATARADCMEAGDAAAVRSPGSLQPRRSRVSPHDSGGQASCPWTTAPMPGPLDRYRAVRARTEALAAPLSDEDQQAQSMPDASPVKWHLAHVTWFFEQMLLVPRPGYRLVDPAYDRLFDSYYESLGPRVARGARGTITRPSAAAVRDYRRRVDAAMADWLARPGALDDARLAYLFELGLNHEQQHQELILTDVLHLFAQSPLKPAYRADAPARGGPARPLGWREFPGGQVEIGWDGQGAKESGFAFDIEGPRHAVLLRPYRLADRLVTNGEWRAGV